MLFILDRQERIVNTLKNGGNSSNSVPYFDDLLTQDLATGAETFKFSTIVDGNISRDVIVGNYVAFKIDGKYKLFQIISTKEYHEEVIYMDVYCECAGLELLNKVVRKQTILSSSLKRFLTSILEDTGWNVGGIAAGAQDTFDLEIENGSVYSVLQNNLAKYGVELEFRVEINNGRISNKFIDTYSSRGSVTGKRFVFSKDIEKIEKTTSAEDLYTALIGQGKNGITFRDVTVDGINKPLGQDFIEDEDAYNRYNNNGYHIMGIYSYDTESPEELLRKTYEHLQTIKDPKVTYEVSVALLGEMTGIEADKVRVGDTVAIVDNEFNPPIHLMGRIVSLETSLTDPEKDTCKLSNFVEVSSNITDEMRKIASELQGYVDGTISDKFPIKSDDIDKGAIKETHIYKDTITTDHLKADCVTAEKIDAKTMTVESGVFDNLKVTTAMLENATIDMAQIENLKVTQAEIGDLAVGTAQIANGEITVAKIQSGFIDDLTVAQGKFTSAHIGTLTSDNIDANTITADHIKGQVISAINMSSEKISADRIDVGSLTVENLDASKITSGTIDADRIGANSITADKMVIGDMSNVIKINPDNTAGDREILLHTDGLNYFRVGPDAWSHFELVRSKTLDFDANDEYVLEYKGFADEELDLTGVIRVYYQDGTKTNLSVVEDIRILTNCLTSSVTFKITDLPVDYKPIDYITYFIEKGNTSTGSFYVRDLKLYKKTKGSLIVNGSITADNIDVGAITAEKIDADAITSDLLKGNVIQAINMSTKEATIESAKISNLDASKITSGSIKTEILEANVVAAINQYVGEAKILQGKIEDLQVGSANITDLDVSIVNVTGKLSAENIKVEEIEIGDANITGTITANKISGGTLDASKMTVTNLKADSITAGSITVQGENLIHNTDFSKIADTGRIAKWDYSEDWNLDTTDKYENTNSFKISRTGLTTDTWRELLSEIIPTTPGETFVQSAYVKSSGTSSTDYLICAIWFYNDKHERVGGKEYYLNADKANWTRFTQSISTPANATKVRLAFSARKNGTFNIVKPMLSKGTIASEWKLHNDELITDGAIDNDKIANEAITSDKLRVEELFVGDNAFINKLKATEIKASNIIADTIRNDLINIQGLVTFEALDEKTMQPLFSVNSGKTYINGNRIVTGSISAKQIDLYDGFSVIGPDGRPSFTIANNGDTSLSGLIQSNNYNSETRTGYKLTPDGTAELNQAVIRGSIELENAGITNFGAPQGNPNIIKSGYITQFGSTSTVNKDKYFVNGGITVKRVGGTDGNGGFYFDRAECYKPNTKYVISFKVKSIGDEITNISFHNGKNHQNAILYLDGEALSGMTSANTTVLNDKKEHEVKLIFTTDSTIKVDDGTNFTYFQPNKGLATKNYEVEIRELKLEEGYDITPWTPHTTEEFNYVRFWAGSDYSGRNKAPFRVMQDGSIFANNGTYEGLLRGRLDSGDVQIDEHELTINSHGTETEIIKFNSSGSFINSNLYYGTLNDKKVDINISNRTLDLNKMDFRASGEQSNIYFNRFSGETGGLNFIGNNGGQHVIRNSNSTANYGSLIFDQQGVSSTNEDFIFTKKNHTQDCRVRIDGTLNVKEKIASSKNKIEIRSVNNEGWGFYAS